MIKYCKDCKYKQNIANTDETGEALCSFAGGYIPINVEDTCGFLPSDKITCKNCEHFVQKDVACLTAEEDDDATDCCGFIDADTVYLTQYCLAIFTRHGIKTGSKIIEETINDTKDIFKRLTEES